MNIKLDPSSGFSMLGALAPACMRGQHLLSKRLACWTTRACANSQVSFADKTLACPRVTQVGFHLKPASHDNL